MEKNNMKILAIDDKNDNLISLKAIIKDIFPNSAIFTELKGAEGIKIASTEDPDVILLDIIMPDMDGFEVCRLLKKNEKTRDIPVVFLTALKGDKDNRIKALEAGAEAFLSKPIDETELTAQIRAMVKIKAANLRKRNEKEYLEKLVAERTHELEHSRVATLNLLDDLKAEIEVRKQKEKTISTLGHMLNVAPGGITVHDMTGKFLYTNTKNLELHGYTKDEFLSMNLHDLDVPESEALINERVEKIKKDGEASFFVHHFRKDGSLIPLEVFAKMTAWNGKPALLSIAADITDRLKAEEKLKKSDRIFNHSIDMLCIAGFDGYFKTLNPAWEKVLGWSKEELLSKPWIEFTHPDDIEKTNNVKAIQLENGKEVYQFENRYVCKNGSVKWLSWNSFPYQEEGIMFGIARDITDRKRAELELKESEERYKALHNASFGGIVIHDKGIILECNQGFSDITGYSYDELIGMNGLLLIAEHARDKVIKNINEGYELPYESAGVRKNGEEYPLRLHANNIPFKGKSVRSTEFRDITEQKKTEIEKEKLTQQLAQAQKMESIGRLAGGVAHDFNNMLSVIIGRTELALMKTGGDSPILDELGEIQNAAERSAALTKQLLAFARKQVISPKILDLNESIEKMISFIKRLIGENIKLNWKKDNDLWNIMMDPSQLDQIFTNLCVNSKDAMPDGGKITIVAENATIDRTDENVPGLIPGDFVRISVEDNGHGMDKETASQIFEPFFTTKEMGKGTGLGLATVFGIVKQNKGYVYCFSIEGVGTRFEIYFPKEEGGKVEESLAKPLCIKGEESITILLVEDEPTILEMFRSMLQIFGYTVISAESPQEALEKSLEHKGEIDLLITDVIMPEMNGRELSKKILSHHPEIKCLFISGYTAEVIAYQGVLDEEMNFIQKPFTMKTLGEKVKTVMGVK